MQPRKAARVLPEPVGAAISVSRPAAISAHPPAWGEVGPSGNRLPNQVRTAGWKVSIMWGPLYRPSPTAARAGRFALWRACHWPGNSGPDHVVHAGNGTG